MAQVGRWIWMNEMSRRASAPKWPRIGESEWKPAQSAGLASGAKKKEEEEEKEEEE